MRKGLGFFVSLLLMCVAFSGYSSKSDSLLRVLPKQEKDTNRVKTLIQLSGNYEFKNPDSSWIFIKEAMQLSQELEYKKGTAICYTYYGYLNDDVGKYDDAIKYYQQSLEVYEEMRLIKPRAGCYNNIGIVYWNMGAFDKALENFRGALSISSELGDKQMMANNYNNLGLISRNTGNLPQAVDYFLKALKLNNELGNKANEAAAHTNLGMVYFDEGDYKESNKHYFISLEIDESIENFAGMATAYNNVGNSYAVMDSSMQAVEYYQKSLEIRQKIGDKHGISSCLTNIGSNYFKVVKDEEGLSRDSIDRLCELAVDKKSEAFDIMMEIGYLEGAVHAETSLAEILLYQGKHKEALGRFKASLDRATRINIKNELKDCYWGVSLAYDSLRDYKSSLEFYKLYTAMKDSLFSESKSKEIGKLEAQYDMEKKQLEEENRRKQEEQRIAEARSRRDNLQYSVIFLAILFFFGLVLGLGFVKVSPTVAEGLIFFAFLILFEFLLVLGDPFVESITGGEPIYKLLANALLAGAIFPAHAFFERVLKKRLVK